MLQPGKNKVYTFLGETDVRVALDKPIKVPGTHTDNLMNDKKFAQQTDLCSSLLDGRVSGAHDAGKYFYFNYYENVSYKLFDFKSGD